MGSIVIAHVIGTVALIVLFSIVGTHYTMYYSTLQSHIVAHNLEEISIHVSFEFLDLVSLCTMSSKNQLVFKQLDIPKNISGNNYDLFIINTGDSFKVIANKSSSFYGESILPWKDGVNIAIYDGSELDLEVKGFMIDPKIRVSSVFDDLVVWCKKTEGTIMVGLGRISYAGGT